MTTCPNCGSTYLLHHSDECPTCGTTRRPPPDLSGLAAREQCAGYRVGPEVHVTCPLPDPEPIVDQPPPKPGRGDILAVQAALAQIQGLAGMLAATVDALARTIVALACEPEIEERRELEAEVQRLREKNDGLIRAVCGDGEQIAGLERELDDLRAENQRLKSRLAGAPWEG